MMVAVRRLFSFPDPVNEVSARVVAGGVVVLCTLTLALQAHWAVYVIAYGFVARVLTGPSLSPLGQLATRVVTPRLPFAARPVPGPPKRFAQGVGALFTVTAAAMVATGQWDVAEALLGAIVVFALLESALGFCMGCTVFGWLMRAGVVPEAVCAQCADVRARSALSA